MIGLVLLFLGVVGIGMAGGERELAWLGLALPWLLVENVLDLARAGSFPIPLQGAPAKTQPQGGCPPACVAARSGAPVPDSENPILQHARAY